MSESAIRANDCTTIANEVSISGRLRTLCADPTNRPYIVRRGILPTLVKFLQHENVDVRLNAAEALRFLSEHPENPEAMCRERGLLQVLANVYQESEDDGNVQLMKICGDIVSCLEAALDLKQEENCGVEGSSTVHAVVSETESAMTAKNRVHRVRQSVVNHARVLVLDVPTLTAANAADLGDILESTRGLVSYTFDLIEHTVNIYAATPSPTLLRLLSERGFAAVIVSEADPSYLTPTPVSAAGRLPRYLSGQSIERHGNGPDHRKTLVLHGLQTNSLSSRMERQKLERARRVREKNATQVGQVQSFFRKITSALW